MPSLSRCACLLSLLASSLLLPSTAAAPASGSSRLLVVLDEKNVRKDDYSQFWSSLEGRGFDLTFRDARNNAPKHGETLTKFEDKLYDGVVVFAPSVKNLPNDLSPQAIFNYLTTASANVTPGNVLFALSPDVTEAWRDFAREFSIDFDERDTTIYDPLHTAPVAGTTGGIAIDVPVNYTYIASPFYNGVSTIFTPATKRNTKPIRYSGLAHTTTELPLLLPLLRAPATAFPIEKKDGPEAALVEGGPFVAGEQAKLVSGFQSRVNSRAVWSGSLDLFSDNFWTEETSNAAFIEDMTKWLFAEKNVVKVLGSRHYKTHDVNKYEHEQYRVGDEVTYELIVTEFDSERGGWFAPSSIHDLQLEVTMLDPHLRIPLHLSTRFEDRSNSNRTYTASFKLPDRHGVFTFLVDHRRQGMSWLEERTQISITPLRHDEYKRFIGGAMPYYLTVGSMVVAWLLFSATWLNLNQDEADTTKARKGNRVQIKQ